MTHTQIEKANNILCEIKELDNFKSILKHKIGKIEVRIKPEELRTGPDVDVDNEFSRKMRKEIRRIIDERLTVLNKKFKEL